MESDVIGIDFEVTNSEATDNLQEINNDLSDLSGLSERAGDGVDSFSNAFSDLPEIKKDIADLSGEFDDLFSSTSKSKDTADGLDNIEDSAVTTKGAMGDLSKEFIKATIAGGAIFVLIKGVTALSDGLKKALGNGAEAEALNADMVSLTGSMSKAVETTKGFRDLANSSPLNASDVNEAGASLLRLGADASEVNDELKDIGDIAVGAKAPLKDVADVFGKVRSSGKIEGADVNKLLGQGIPIIDELAKVTGKSKDEINSLVLEGKIGFPEVSKAFKSLTAEGGKFNGAMARQSQTVQGLQGILKGKVEELFTTLGSGLVDHLKPALQLLIGLVDKLQPKVKAFAEKLSFAIASVFEVFKSGVALDIIKLTLVIAGKSFISALITGLLKFRGILIGTVKSIPTLLKGLFTLILGYYKTVGALAKHAGLSLASGFLVLLNKGLKKVGLNVDGAVASVKNAQANAGNIKDDLASIALEVKSGMLAGASEGAKIMADEIKKSVEGNSTSAFDTTSEADKLAGILLKVKDTVLDNQAKKKAENNEEVSKVEVEEELQIGDKGAGSQAIKALTSSLGSVGGGFAIALDGFSRTVKGSDLAKNGKPFSEGKNSVAISASDKRGQAMLTSVNKIYEVLTRIESRGSSLPSAGVFS